MGQLPVTVQADLRREGVVGDLCAHMFERGGRFVDHEVSRRTLSIGVDELRRIPCVVAVAGGVSKAASLLGAVRTGVPRVLITDQLAAESQKMGTAIYANAQANAADAGHEAHDGAGTEEGSAPGAAGSTDGADEVIDAEIVDEGKS